MTPAALHDLALPRLATADTSNPFSAKLNAALWIAKTVAEGGTGDLFYSMNKAASGDDLGLTLQTGFSTKALVGLFGSDRFRLAVSADGSTFFDGLSVDNASGIVDQPRLPRITTLTRRACQAIVTRVDAELQYPVEPEQEPLGILPASARGTEADYPRRIGAVPAAVVASLRPETASVRATMSGIEDWCRGLVHEQLGERLQVLGQPIDDLPKVERGHALLRAEHSSLRTVH